MLLAVGRASDVPGDNVGLLLDVVRGFRDSVMVPGCRVLDHRGGDRERVVLPDTPGQRWEVQVRVARTRHTRNKYAKILMINNSNFSRPYTILRQSQKTCNAVEAPHGHADNNPYLVAPLMLELEDNVPVAACHDQDRDHDMPGEE